VVSLEGDPGSKPEDISPVGQRSLPEFLLVAAEALRQQVPAGISLLLEAVTSDAVKPQLNQRGSECTGEAGGVYHRHEIGKSALAALRAASACWPRALTGASPCRASAGVATDKASCAGVIR